MPAEIITSQCSRCGAVVMGNGRCPNYCDGETVTVAAPLRESREPSRELLHYALTWSSRALDGKGKLDTRRAIDWLLDRVDEILPALTEERAMPTLNDPAPFRPIEEYEPVDNPKALTEERAAATTGEEDDPANYAMSEFIEHGGLRGAFPYNQAPEQAGRVPLADCVVTQKEIQPPAPQVAALTEERDAPITQETAR